ncbi:MAG: hypothetical protein ACI93R_000882 [Flavobacteriales bacterium]|jgi:hypothetical protein
MKIKRYTLPAMAGKHPSKKHSQGNVRKKCRNATSNVYQEKSSRVNEALAAKLEGLIITVLMARSHGLTQL